jgi:hypothetical protein
VLLPPTIYLSLSSHATRVFSVERIMTKIAPRLFLAAFLLLICFTASGTAFAQVRTGGGGGGCCAVAPTVDIETVPASVTTSVEITQENGVLLYSFLESSPGFQEYKASIVSESNRNAVRDRRFIGTGFNRKDLHPLHRRV